MEPPHPPGREPRTVEVEACPLCGSPDAVELWSQPDRLHDVPGSWRYVRCEDCGSAYQAPRVSDEDLSLLYPGAYYTHTPRVPAAEAATGIRGWLRRSIQSGGALSRVRALRERAWWGLVDEVIPRQSSGGRALEIGPGSGWELGLLRRAGWRAEGIEFDEHAAIAARTTSGAPVRVGDFRELVAEGEQYDLIYLSHVFEHLADPGVVFAFARTHLAPGGRAVLVFPNLDGASARRWGPAWLAWDPPRHLVLPSRAGLLEMGRRHGLSVTLRTRSPSAAAMHAASRRIRAGENGGQVFGRPSIGDRIAGLSEHLALAFGRPTGQETVATLEVST